MPLLFLKVIVAFLYSIVSTIKPLVMAYNEKLADRVREFIATDNENIEEKAMFGGLCFMVNDKMCVGVEMDRMMVRLDPTKYEEVLENTTRSQKLQRRRRGSKTCELRLCLLGKYFPIIYRLNMPGIVAFHPLYPHDLFFRSFNNVFEDDPLNTLCIGWSC